MNWWEKRRRQLAAIEKAKVRETVIVHDHTDVEVWEVCHDCHREVFHTMMPAHRYKVHGVTRNA